MAVEDEEISPELLLAIQRELDRIAPIFKGKVEDLVMYGHHVRSLLIDQKRIMLLQSPKKILRDQISCYAIDSSFQVSPLSLVYGDLLLMTAGYVRYPRIDHSDPEINKFLTAQIFLSEIPMRSLEISVRAHILERKLAIRKLLKEKISSENKINAIVLDGPILPLSLPPPNYSFVNDLIEVTKELVELCDENNIALIGVVKRVRSKILISLYIDEIARIFGLPQDKINVLKEILNDKALALLILEPPEYIHIGKYSQPEVLNAVCWRRVSVSEILNRVPFLGLMDMYIYKAFDALQPTFVEIINNTDISNEAFLGWLASLTGYTGYPLFLDLIDAYVSFRYNVVEIIRIMLTRRLCHEVPDPNIIKLLEHTDLQKKYTPRMG